jgi:hypothetical protein
MMRSFAALLFAFTLLVSSAASAHKPSDSYLMLEKTTTGLHGRWDIALRDLEPVVNLDANHDGTVNWGELKARFSAIAAYTKAHLSARSETGICPLVAQPQGVISHSDGKYVAFSLEFSCPPDATPITLSYDLLFELDAQHRGILRYTDEGKVQPFVFGKAQRSVTLSRVTPRFASIVGLGIEHIWSGYDHLLFLIVLLLPAVLRRRDGVWKPAATFRDVLLDVLRTVTAFTVAHSLTLALSAAHWVVLPSRFVESAIAASIVLAALNNLCPVLDAERTLSFGLGLLHGFGFAAVLSDVGLSGQSFLRMLFGFNLGVELGQLAIVMACLPVLHLLRRSRLYPTWGLPMASTAVMLVACVWLAERAFDLEIIS